MNKPTVVWGVSLFDVDTLKDATHNVTSIHIDRFSNMAKVVIEKGTKVEVLNISMDEAQRIGFININALTGYCLKIK
jgi:NADH/NAD ratio-sensing transcriptional regulator Rex